MTLRASILVADDDETSARFLKRLLTKEGHDVSVVHNAVDALSTCHADPPDLVLVTAHGDRADRLKGIEAGCDDFLTKPFDSTELHARIQSLVRLKRYTDEL